MNYLAQFLALEAVHLPLLVMPGAVFALVSSNSLLHSRKTGLYSVLGVITGTTLVIFSAIAGLGFLVVNSPAAFQALRLLGTGYLLYLGGSMLLRKPPGSDSLAQAKVQPGGLRTVTRGRAMRDGFLAETLNPSGLLFALSIFSQIIDPGTPRSIVALYGTSIVLVVASYFLLVVFFFSDPRVVRRLNRFMPILQKIAAVIILAFALKLGLEPFLR